MIVPSTISSRMRRTLNTSDSPADRLHLRAYQREAFENRVNGIECWLWGRQTGKSYTLAAWAIDRLVTRPGRLVTILSNSLSNGMELNQKCAAVARVYSRAFQQVSADHIEFEAMKFEIRVRIGGELSRIKILPANPRTARGFSGDLILDEFAFHENSDAIWEAAEPILSANADFLCRIASTANGHGNMFYRLSTDPRIVTRRVPRSLAWTQGLVIAHPHTRQPITPWEARELSYDKRAYDQNYECIFGSNSRDLLTDDLISNAEDAQAGVICEDTWSPDVVHFLGESPDGPGATRDLFIGVDVGRNQNLTVITVVQKVQNVLFVRALLRLRNIRLPDQQDLLEVPCRSPRFAALQIDMTGLGLGLFEYTHRRFGDRVRGLHFSTSIPFPDAGASKKVKAPEVLALRLLQVYESNRIRHPIDHLLRHDLKSPRTIQTGGGRVSIVAAQTKDGHADHFWSIALAIDAALRTPIPQIYVPRIRESLRINRKVLC